MVTDRAQTRKSHHKKKVPAVILGKTQPTNLLTFSKENLSPFEQSLRPSEAPELSQAEQDLVKLLKAESEKSSDESENLKTDSESSPDDWSILMESLVGNTSGSERSETFSTSSEERTPKFRRIEEKLNNSFSGAAAMLQLVAMGVASKSLFLDGVSVMNHGPALSTSLVDVAENNPKVAAWLEKLVAVTEWAPVFDAVAGLANEVAKNHGLAVFNVPK